MPARKSDHRKSDVTSARFALADDLPESKPGPSPAPSQPAAPSTASAPPGADDTSTPAPSSEKKEKEKDKDKDKDKDVTTIEDLTLPKSIITRLAKGVLPPNTQIQANAILAISKSATVFINYLAAHANENTVNANKKTIAPADVFKALDEIEMGFLREPLEAEFAKFSAMQTEKRTSYRQKVRATKGPSGTNPGDDTDMADTTVGDTTTASAHPADDSQLSAPRAKKARVEGGAADAEVDDAETEDDDVEDEDEDDAEEEEEEEEAEQEGEGSGDETQDALEERGGKEERDEALDGDESD